jgi:hypothetical protein
LVSLRPRSAAEAAAGSITPKLASAITKIPILFNMGNLLLSSLGSLSLASCRFDGANALLAVTKDSELA